jgi:membrane protease YdiL (CAAX protease family)
MSFVSWYESLRWAVVVFLVFVGPFLDVRLMKRMRETRESALRLKFYRYGTVSLWTTGIVCYALIGSRGVIRLAPVVLAQAGWLSRWGWRVGAVGLCAGFFVLALLPGVVCLFRERSRKAYTAAVVKSGISFILPIGNLERRWYAVLSVAAGICEEVIFRGFLLTFARDELRMGLLVALLATSVVFGFNHLYQGFGGIVKTALVGLMLGLVAVLSGGLLLPMLLHAAIDLQMLAMYKPAAEETATATVA